MVARYFVFTSFLTILDRNVLQIQLLKQHDNLLFPGSFFVTTPWQHFMSTAETQRVLKILHQESPQSAATAVQKARHAFQKRLSQSQCMDGLEGFIILISHGDPQGFWKKTHHSSGANEHLEFIHCIKMTITLRSCCFLFISITSWIVNSIFQYYIMNCQFYFSVRLDDFALSTLKKLATFFWGHNWRFLILFAGQVPDRLGFFNRAMAIKTHRHDTMKYWLVNQGILTLAYCNPFHNRVVESPIYNLYEANKQGFWSLLNCWGQWIKNGFKAAPQFMLIE